MDSPALTISLDLKGNILTADHQVCELLGRSVEELRKHKVTDFWRVRDRQRMAGDYLQHLGDFVPSGRIHYVNLETAERNHIPVRLRTGRLPAGALSTLGDVAVTIESISAKEVIHRAIDLDLESLKEFSETFSYPVFLKDVEHRFQLVNAEFCDDLSCDQPEEVIGKWDADFFPKSQCKRYIDDDNYVLAYAQVLETTELHTPPGGVPIQVHVFRLPYYRAGRGAPWGVVCIYWPVEERDRALGLMSFKG